MARVKGIEPSRQAWKAGALPLSYTRNMVGAAGFEPATPWSQARCATKLRYAPFCQHCYYSKSVDLRQPLILRFIQLNS